VATANDLITAALRRGRCIGKDQVPTADEAADCLAELNRMLDEWWNDGLAVFQIKQENFPLVANQASRTIGVGGNFNTTRPLKLLDGCFVRRNGIDSWVTVLEDRTLYDGIGVKTATGLVKYVYYDPAMPTGTLYFYPVPDQADTIYLNSPARLQNVAALVTAISLPPGYDGLVLNGLAVREAPEYGLEAPASVVKVFGRAMRILKRTNTKRVVMQSDPALLPRTGYVDIRNVDV
jgi:hypothetical protein